MVHNVVVNLKNSNVLYGYYRTDNHSQDPNEIPNDLPISMTIEPEDGGPAVSFRLEDAKAVFFVNTFTGSPTQQDVRFFDAVSIQPFLWVRLAFEDGEIMEGRVTNDLDL
ncbi:MAG: hypothetical protein V4587_19055 [Acidobacteriota bacterium]